MTLHNQSPAVLITFCLGIFLSLFLLFVWGRAEKKRVEPFYPVNRRLRIRKIVRWKNFLGGGFFFLGMIFIGFAFFRPHWGVEVKEFSYTGKDIMFCIDISNSMLAEDTGISRLKNAGIFGQWMLEKYPENNYGVTVFKGNGVVSIPLTRDRYAVRQFLENVTPGYSTVPGTDVGKGLAAAVSGFSEQRPGKRYVFLFSDGENFEGDPFSAKMRKLLSGTEIWTFVTGTVTGGTIVTKEKGKVVTKADPGLLRNISKEYSGRHFNVLEEGWWDRFDAEFKSSESGAGETGFIYREVPASKSRFFLLLGVAFLILYIFTRAVLWRNPK